MGAVKQSALGLVTDVQNFRQLNDDGSVTVFLRYPVVHHDKEITQLTLRSMVTVADLESMDNAKGEVKKTIALISELSGVSVAAIRKLASIDYAEIQGVVSEIMGKEPGGIGKTS